MDTFNTGDEGLLIWMAGSLMMCKWPKRSFNCGRALVRLSYSSRTRAVHCRRGGAYIAFNLELSYEDILRVAQGVAKLPNVVETAKANQDLMAGIVDSILGSALVDSLSLTE
ncbi:hypothetical protein RhiXN_03957 [Rhizoctonia solani]|uniref:Uncharacterized protein n=1 Tax=Rhizoctonia solani TaxID=456999 RepID=A0A8H8SRP0_9AGAM|nr:uncharacterized protein RhiXN_03957 [Rhizoctonia solani]QRW15956.1 hypothetical protein RhiXN_03957 [Rhizoctonia solani]